jgi:hypothetical protein
MNNEIKISPYQNKIIERKIEDKKEEEKYQKID